MTLKLETRAQLACLYSGAVWGLYWIPLRAMESAGMHNLWITSVYFMVPALFVLPIFLWRWRSIRAGGLDLQITVMASGIALTFYSASIVYTDVVRALVLFYTMPVWSAFLARIFLGESITLPRILAMVIAIVGMLVLFGLGIHFPIPQNIGDWMGLCAGIFWAVTMVRLRRDAMPSSLDLTIGFFFWGLVFSAATAMLLARSELPSLDQVSSVLPMLALFMVLLVLPGTYTSLWGPKYLNPGIAGMLFMTEIVVGAISAALLTGEPFGIREIIGVIMIGGASMIEPILTLSRKRNAAKFPVT